MTWGIEQLFALTPRDEQVTPIQLVAESLVLGGRTAFLMTMVDTWEPSPGVPVIWWLSHLWVKADAGTGQSLVDWRAYVEGRNPAQQPAMTLDQESGLSVPHMARAVRLNTALPFDSRTHPRLRIECIFSGLTNANLLETAVHITMMPVGNVAPGSMLKHPLL